jgi:bacterioferritin-associated ferredoxin
VTELDLSDPAIREMVERYHTPEELYTVAGLAMVNCGQCGHEWPCPPIQEVRRRARGEAKRLVPVGWSLDVGGHEVHRYQPECDNEQTCLRLYTIRPSIGAT